MTAEAAGGPPGRMAHSLTYNPTQAAVVLVGGVAADENLLGDTWLYSASSGWIADEGLLPARAYHRTVYTDDAIVLFSNSPPPPRPHPVEVYTDDAIVLFYSNCQVKKCYRQVNSLKSA